MVVSDFFRNFASRNEKLNMKRKVRIKGTDIYVKCIGASSGGMICKYLNGDLKGAGDVIPDDCLVEEYEDTKP